MNEHITAPTLCIYHSPCQDGFSAAWAVWERFGDYCRFLPGVYGEPPADVGADDDVVIVDFSYDTATMQQLAERARTVTVLDHHVTAAAALEPLLKSGVVHGKFDMARSGAALTWEWFHPEEPVPALLLHVEDRDLWKFSLHGTREISAALFSYPYEFDIWSDLADRAEKLWGDLYAEGAAIDRRFLKDIAELLPVVTRRMTIAGHEVPVANLPYTMASEAAGRLAEKAPFAAAYFDRTDGKRVFSLRSRPPDGIDVSEIAKVFGGGGHRHAAGFQVDAPALEAIGP